MKDIAYFNDIKGFKYYKHRNKYFVFDNNNGNWQIGLDIDSIIFNLEKKKSNKNKDSNKVQEILNIVLHITNKCNLQCSYCYANANNKHSKAISIDNILKLIEVLNINSINNINFIFHGGEPLIKLDLLKKIVNIIKTNYQGNYFFSIQTNGTILNDTIIDYIVKEKINLSISLDGYQEIHDKHRVDLNNTGSHSRVLRNIRILQEKNVEFAVNSVLTEHCNPKELFEFYLENRIRGFKLEPVVNYGRSNGSNVKAMTIKYNEFIKELFLNNINSDIKLQEGRLMSFVYKLSGQSSPIICDNEHCNFGVRMLMIDEYGDIYPCEEFYRQKQYRTYNIQHCNNYDQIKKKTSELILKQQRSKEKLCKNCTIKCFCPGICPSQLFSDDISLCYFKKNTILNYIILIMENHSNIDKLF